MRDRGNILPLAAVTIGAFLVFVVAPLIARRNTSAQMAPVEPHVSIGIGTSTGVPSVVTTYRWPNSEVPRSAERLRDVTGVAIAAMSYVVEAALNSHTPLNSDEILKSIAGRDLISKDWLTAEPGVLQMRNGWVHLRFSASDLSLELVSVPRDSLDGPAFLLRLPDPENTSGSVRYFESTQLDGIVYPAPFTPLPQVISAGWQPRLFKQTALPDEQRAMVEQATHKP